MTKQYPPRQMALEVLFQGIEAELSRQETKWGHKIDDTVNTPWMWTAYVANEGTRWMVGTFPPLHRSVTDRFREAMLKVAAVAIAAVMSVDRQRNLGGTFYEE